jgi:hypothetical protein
MLDGAAVSQREVDCIEMGMWAIFELSDRRLPLLFAALPKPCDATRLQLSLFLIQNT